MSGSMGMFFIVGFLELISHLECQLYLSFFPLLQEELREQKLSGPIQSTLNTYGHVTARVDAPPVTSSNHILQIVPYWGSHDDEEKDGFTRCYFSSVVIDLVVLGSKSITCLLPRIGNYCLDGAAR